MTPYRRWWNPRYSGFKGRVNGHVDTWWPYYKPYPWLPDRIKPEMLVGKECWEEDWCQGEYGPIKVAGLP